MTGCSGEMRRGGIFVCLFQTKDFWPGAVLLQLFSRWRQWGYFSNQIKKNILTVIHCIRDRGEGRERGGGGERGYRKEKGGY